MAQRDPSIHVRRTSLFDILESLDYLNEVEVESLVSDIFHGARQFPAMNRSQITAKAATRKKAERVNSVATPDAEAFNSIYQSVLLEKGVRATTITKNDGRYITMKEVAAHAKEFCDMFELKKEVGYKTYVSLGIEVAGSKFTINYLKGLSDRIIKTYENYQTIHGDVSRESTTEFYTYWKAVSQKYTGRAESITEPHLYVHFVHGREAADEAKAPYAEWIVAQFERWAGMGSTPELSQFYGDNAKIAYMKYSQKRGRQDESEQEKQVRSKKEIPIKGTKSKRGRK